MTIFPENFLFPLVGKKKGLEADVKSASDVHRWKQESSQLRVMLFESIAGRTMDQLGMKRKFNGVSRHLGLLAAGLYYPVGGVVAAMQRLYGSLPQWIQSNWRQNQLLRSIKRAVTRC